MTSAAIQGKSVKLGSVSCPSGVLVVLDVGSSWIWSHDQPPAGPFHQNFRDLAITGIDARIAGLAFNRSNMPRFVFDQPLETIETSRLAFADLIAAQGFRASLDVLPEQILHRRRVALALGDGDPLARSISIE